MDDGGRKVLGKESLWGGSILCVRGNAQVER